MSYPFHGPETHRGGSEVEAADVRVERRVAAGRHAEQLAEPVDPVRAEVAPQPPLAPLVEAGFTAVGEDSTPIGGPPWAS